MDNRFKHYLNFIGTTLPGRLEIAEPVKFDGQSYIIESEQGRYGLDVHYSNPDLKYAFWKTTGAPSDEPQILPDGQIVHYLTHGIEYLFEYRRLFGWEARVEYIISLDGIDTVLGELDFKNVDTDSYRRFECNVIDGSNKAKMKRDADTAIDLYSDEDVNGSPITPLTPTNILLKAKPITASSQWKQPESRQFEAGKRFFNYARQLNGEIRRSLVPFIDESDSVFYDFEDAVNDFDYIDAADDLSATSIRLEVDYIFKYRFVNSGFSPNAVIRCVLVVAPNPYVGVPFLIVSPFVPAFGTLQYGNEIFKKVLYFKEISDGIDQDVPITETIIADIPFCPRDHRISVFWEVGYSDGHLGDGSTAPTSWLMNNTEFEISTTQTGIDSVGKGVWLNEAIEQTVKSIAGDTYPVLAPRYQTGGEHKLNVYMNGWGLRLFTDKPLISKWKDNGLSMQEPNCDYFMRQYDVLVQQYEEFYPSNDLGGFLEYPPETYNEVYAQDYLLKLFERQYVSYEQDRSEQNTIDSVHTKEQKRIAGKVELQRGINFPHIRDPFAIESARRQSVIAKPTTSLSTDDSIFLIDCVDLSPGSFGTFGARLQVRQNSDGSLTILNQNSESSPSFGWNTLGVGSNIQIDGGGNQGMYNVSDVQVSLITIFPITPITVEQGDVYMNFKYYFSGVAYTNRTNEGFDLIENVASPQNYGNLRYTFGNMGISKWGAFWAACMKHTKLFPLRTTQFINNGKLRTRKTGASVIIQEDMDITFDMLPDAVIDPLTFETQFVADYARMKQLMYDVEYTQGFIRLLNPSGKVLPVFIRKLEYIWSTGLCKVLVMKKEGADDVTISIVDGVLNINKTGYPDEQISSYDWFEVNNGYVRIFDNERKDIITPTLFNEISIEGVFYANENDFRNAMLALRP